MHRRIPSIVASSLVLLVFGMFAIAAVPIGSSHESAITSDDVAVAARLDAAVNAGELEAWKAALMLDLLRRLEDPDQRYLEEAARLDRSVEAGTTSRIDAVQELIVLRRTLWGAERKPRPVHRPQPVLNDDLRAKGPAQVVVRIMVGVDGRVKNAVVARSSDDAFESATLEAVRRWRFAPAIEDGLFTTSRLQVPITFPGPDDGSDEPE